MVELKTVGEKPEILIKGELNEADYRRLEDIVLALMFVPSPLAVLIVESDGGTLRGLREVVLALLRLKDKKFIACFTREALSAAYWIASVAHVVYASPSALVGGVGVVAIHDNLRRYYEMIGIERTFFVSEKNERKIEFSSYSSLTEEAKARLQQRLNASAEEFMNSIERHRSLKVSREVWASGEAFDANDALKFGLVDRVVHPFDFEMTLKEDYKMKILEELK